jgi:hypothetical protein
MFSHGSSSSTSLAIVTPSFVIVGAPHFLSSTTFWPLGPSVIATVSASLSTPASRPRLASSPNFSSFEATGVLLFHRIPSKMIRAGLAFREPRPLRSLCYFPTTARTSRAERIWYSVPSLPFHSVPPYFE